MAGSTQTTMTVLLQTSMASFALWLWINGKASTGDVAYVLATFTLIQGYLREMATHFRNLQKSVNEMSDLATIALLPVGVQNKPGSKPLNARAMSGELTNSLCRLVLRFSMSRYSGATWSASR